MALHLIKLCVGCESVEDLEDWIALKLDEKRRAGMPVEQFHTTRMVPKRVEELLDGGSLYWIIKGGVQCRQRLIDVRPFTDAEGVGRCRLVLDPEVVRTEWQPRRPFQGWRYLDPKDVPADLSGAGTDDELPLELRRELTELGLL
ncbi:MULTISPECIES: DUF1489 family protein [unclassified Aminobacter]|uniref:DUF1489 family protein n=1 Tax=unclassified Aminobacter TaxID=2644704 RepID=UPI00046443CE|nr:MULTISPECIES: DUF1489 family protein [unclassified Aminobacter]TWG59370.1 hypothetical protein L610_000300000060 [Aminobacter sp. J44]TWH33638.1 hypothetical protein L611_000200001580 [Aminobacter sp. J15]